jgi:glycine/D-amino acid oxidase-like deaminating enzyme
LSALTSSCSRGYHGERHFARVKASPERVIRTVTGLRPYRSSGFVVKPEPIGRKTIIPNYGHGGGGITLSWGTAHLAMEQALATGQQTFAVLGCGAVGLATARLLQRHGSAVTIYAKDLPPQTTSNIAGGQWSPYSVFDSDKGSAPFMDQFSRAARLAHRYYQDLVGDYYGVHWIENYILSDHPPRNGGGEPFGLHGLFPESKLVPKGEHPFAVPYVSRFTTMLIEPPVYLNAVMRDFLLTGGKLVVREFRDMAAVGSLTESVIVNCTGLGAKALFKDQELTPIKGQLTILLPQPEVDYITLGPADLYMFPRRDGILLGGTHEEGNWTLEPDAQAAERIMQGHMKVFREMS